MTNTGPDALFRVLFPRKCFLRAIGVECLNTRPKSVLFNTISGYPRILTLKFSAFVNKINSKRVSSFKNSNVHVSEYISEYSVITYRI
jgi:hypothetical protein